ncbi:28S ribosomal mitochondrial [Micractinium conductrix]|uniref:28S ribosomal mitochondrial n=1 Tax=Micractinium conductrix TaxID=554055 RepID=A0A2P6VLS6_9CHLO|nr:28S ribosomal mitochondrial [Micractinium conductrix]|eukprot:PSC75015.1 28S ribosomal mitochondrial [Micractinium conductrix]
MRWSAVLQAKNAFELLSRLPKHGLGSNLSRTGWTDDCYWTIEKVKVSPNGKHGTAWGVLTWRGTAHRPEAPTTINGPLKRVWRVVQDEDPAGPWQSLVGAALRQERRAAAAEPAAAEGSAQEAAEAAQPVS